MLVKKEKLAQLFNLKIGDKILVNGEYFTLGTDYLLHKQNSQGFAHIAYLTNKEYKIVKRIKGCRNYSSCDKCPLCDLDNCDELYSGWNLLERIEFFKPDNYEELKQKILKKEE